MNKQTYIAPKIESIVFHVEGIIAASIEVSDQTYIDDERNIYCPEKDVISGTWEE